MREPSFVFVLRHSPERDFERLRLSVTASATPCLMWAGTEEKGNPEKDGSYPSPATDRLFAEGGRDKEI